MGNLGGFGIPRGHYMEPYGGVKICLEAGTESWQRVTRSSDGDKIGSSLAGAYSLGVDLPLCVVADTLTLPVTIRAVLRGEAQTGPVQWGQGASILQAAPAEILPPEDGKLSEGKSPSR
jgi:uncharacterized protein YceK